jgi:hypothetical protein
VCVCVCCECLCMGAHDVFITIKDSVHSVGQIEKWSVIVCELMCELV